LVGSIQGQLDVVVIVAGWRIGGSRCLCRGGLCRGSLCRWDIVVIIVVVAVGSRRRGRRGWFVESGSWDGVRCESLVSVEEHSGIGVFVETGECNTSGVGLSISRNSELNATNVRLDSIEVIGSVKGKDFTTKKVVSGSDIIGDLNVNATTVINQFVNSPLSVAESIFIDFEPDVSGTSVTLSHVDHDGTDVGTFYDVIMGSWGCVVPLESEHRSGCNWALSVGGLVSFG